MKKFLFIYSYKMKYRVKECESIEMMIREREKEEDGKGGNYLQHMEGIEEHNLYLCSFIAIDIDTILSCSFILLHHYHHLDAYICSHE